jgi:DNA polymerase-3 subunit beta
MIELTLTKNEFLSALLAISGAVDKKQSLLILSNILLDIRSNRLFLTATDLEIEMSASLPYIASSIEAGKTTIPAKKLLDIIRSLDEGELRLLIDAACVTVKSGRSQFKLSTLPADQYPSSDQQIPDVEFTIARSAFLHLIQSTYFAMAQQDVRMFLNSLLIEMDGQVITTVSMDGHRMAVSRFSGEYNFTNQQFLLPRRGVLEMLRLLNVIQDEELTITAGKGYFRVHTEQFSFITKLTEAKFPHYRKAIPKSHDKFVLIDREQLKRSLSRISILANEKTHGVLINIQPGSLILIAKNQEQEEANEQLEATVDGEPLKIGINAAYLLDVLNYFADGLVRLSLSTTEQSILVESVANENYQYIIMPMKL